MGRTSGGKSHRCDDVVRGQAGDTSNGENGATANYTVRVTSPANHTHLGKTHSGCTGRRHVAGRTRRGARSQVRAWGPPPREWVVGGERTMGGLVQAPDPLRLLLSFSSDPGHVALAGGPGGRHPQPCSTAREGPHPGPGHSHGTAERIPWLTCPREAEARLSAVPRPRRTWPPLPRAKGMSRAQRPILCPHPQNAVVWAWPRLESSVWNPTTQARSTHFTDQGGKCGGGAWAAQAGRRGPGQGQVTVALRTVRPVEGKPPKALLRCSVEPRSRRDKPGGGGVVLLHREVPAGVPAHIVQNPCRMPSCSPHGADGQRPMAQGHKAYKIAEHQPRADAPRYGLG